MVESEQGGRLAVIVHDRSLLDQPELLAGVVAAARLALDRDRLQMELRANIVELERERDFVRDVVNASPALFCVLDLEGRIVRFNEAVVRATGTVDDERVRGRLLADVLVAARDRCCRRRRSSSPAIPARTSTGGAATAAARSWSSGRSRRSRWRRASPACS